jgi:peptidoglycan/xylan/chitin deacetylase (PgdA/CDA1 family)
VVIKDRNLHIVLVAAIAVLAATAVYLRFFYLPDPYQEAFLSRIGKFDLEHSLQEKASEITPGAIKVPILIYHSVRPHSPDETPLQKYYDVAPESFYGQLQYLKDHNYVVISLDYLAVALDQNITLPDKSVVITFDDGWRSQYAWAFPVLRKYNYTATFFVFTNAIGQDYFLTWDQVRVLNNAGMIIGSHTETHPYLPNVKDINKLKEEITGSKRVIEDQIGQKIDLFAYPYGYYTDQIINVVKEAGYAAARSAYHGIYNARDDLFKLKGVEVTDDFNKFVASLNY